MNDPQPHRRAEPPAACWIAGHALVEAPLSQLAALRDQPGPPGAPALPPRFLRHSDEHTVVGMHAVLRALAARGGDVAGHAVVSASCQIGRLSAARTLANLATGGGVSVSPHIVPQCSLHSVAGAVSVGLGMHGPHLGVGGGAGAFAEGLLAAATLVQAGSSAGDPPCVWLVFTEWVVEPEIDPAGKPLGDPVCRGLALAIERGTSGDETAGGATGGAQGRDRAAAAATPSASPASLRLSVHPADVLRPRLAGGPTVAEGLARFARALDMCRDGTALVSWAVECPWGAVIRVSRVPRPAARAVPAARRREAA